MLSSIKVALTQGCAIVPGYLFGNTKVLRLLDWSWLRAFSRKTGIAITYFYGRFFVCFLFSFPCFHFNRQDLTFQPLLHI